MEWNCFRRHTPAFLLIVLLGFAQSRGTKASDSISGPPQVSERLLKNKPYLPQNFDLFPSKAYGGAPASPQPLSIEAAAVGAELSKILNQMVRHRKLEEHAAGALLDRFDDPATRTHFTSYSNNFHARLLAATLLLSGTSAREALPTLLDEKNPTGQSAQIIFTNFAPRGIAKTAIVSAQKGPLWLITLNGSPDNPRMMGEPLQVLAATLAHEAMHQDNEQSQNEEIAAKWVERIVWAEFLLLDPELAHVRTPVTRVMNLEQMMWLNSGSELPWPGLRPAPIRRVEVAPRAKNLSYRSYEQFLREQLYAALAGEPTAANDYLDRLLGDHAPHAHFDNQLLATLDHLKPFRKEQLARMLNILKLRPSTLTH